VRSSADVLCSVGRYSSLARPNNHVHVQRLHQRPNDDFYSSTTWPIHIPLSSSAHRAVRPLLRTRTSRPLHRLAAACSSVRAVVHKVCGECAKDPPTRPAPGSEPAFLNIQRQRACVDHPSQYLLYPSLLTLAQGIPASHHLLLSTSPRSSTAAGLSSDRVQPYPKATT
jgi:hypothetical protein